MYPSQIRLNLQNEIKEKCPLIKPLKYIIKNYFDIKVQEKDIEYEKQLCNNYRKDFTQIRKSSHIICGGKKIYLPDSTNEELHDWSRIELDDHFQFNKHTHVWIIRGSIEIIHFPHQLGYGFLGRSGFLVCCDCGKRIEKYNCSKII
jgi:hypothetical protein